MWMEGYGTYGPVPIRMGTFVAALFDESVFEEVDVVPVPREEITGIVNLSAELRERDGRATRRPDVRGHSSPYGHIRYLRSP